MNARFALNAALDNERLRFSERSDFGIVDRKAECFEKLQAIELVLDTVR